MSAPGLSECERVGMPGNCGLDCQAYLAGDCDAEQEIRENLSGKNLEWHRKIYGGEAMSFMGFECERSSGGCGSTNITVVERIDLTRGTTRAVSGSPCLCDLCYVKVKAKVDKVKDKVPSIGLHSQAQKSFDSCKKPFKYGKPFSVKSDPIRKAIKQSFKSKGSKMKVLPKILRRGIVLWCVYGLVRLAILVNPLIVVWGHMCENALDQPNTGNGDAGAFGWFTLIVAIALLLALSWAVHKFSTWLFNEKR